MEEENQNRADENSPDNASGNVIPMSETLRLDFAGKSQRQREICIASAKKR